MFYVIGLLIFLLLWYYFMPIYLEYRRHFVMTKNMAGPPTIPILGNALHFNCKNEEILGRVDQLCKKYGPSPFRFWLGPHLFIIISDPKHVEKVMTSSIFYRKFSKVYKFPAIVLGNALITGNGPHLKAERKAIIPMLNLNFLAKSLGPLDTHVNICIERLEKLVNKGTFNFIHECHPCYADYVKEVILGSDERSQKTGISPFDDAMIKGYEHMFARMFKFWQHFDFLYNLTPLKTQQDTLKHHIHTKGREMIKEAYERFNNPVPGRFHAIIDDMVEFLEENPGFFKHEDDFLCHILTLYAASEDTLTIVTSFLVMCLGMNPECQQKVLTEIIEVFGKTPRDTTTEDLQKLPYLTMCIKETLRLFTIAPLIARECSEDFQLDEYIIPQGCAVGVVMYTMHRDPQYWEKPNDFYPEHFLPDAVSNRPTYCYMPFSFGARSCIGKLLANTAIKVFMVKLLQLFEIEADGDVSTLKIKMDISIRPVHGCLVRLKKREWT
ncbi:hypothetical protein ABEB36_012504 [Hypothenemus hampei]|uniref:Cytochrome P450 4aa1 n=1 Tax=Hypothenemus hampei TaxID=57062 RepID=A0ABD1EBG3_HYPHA